METPGLNNQQFEIIFDQDWLDRDLFCTEFQLVVGKDIIFFGQAEPDGDGFRFKFKAISEKAIRLLGNGRK